jgi:hypothetical protein
VKTKTINFHARLPSSIHSGPLGMCIFLQSKSSKSASLPSSMVPPKKGSIPMLFKISISEFRASKSSNKCSFHRYLYSCNTVKCAYICSSQGLCELNYLFFSKTSF